MVVLNERENAEKERRDFQSETKCVVSKFKLISPKM